MKVNKNRQPVRLIEDRTGLAADEKHPAVKAREEMRQRVAAYSLTFGFLGIWGWCAMPKDRKPVEAYQPTQEQIVEARCPKYYGAVTDECRYRNVR